MMMQLIWQLTTPVTVVVDVGKFQDGILLLSDVNLLGSCFAVPTAIQALSRVPP